MSRTTALRKSQLETEQQDAQISRFTVFTQRDLDKIEQLKALPEAVRFDMRVVSSVLPFRVNAYVIDQLIDWSRVPEDPIYQLTFPQRGMLKPETFERMATAIREQWPREQVQELSAQLRAELNPHPAGQLQMNIPFDRAGAPLMRIPRQTCH